MKIFVTGGTGLIGSALIDRLVDTDHDVLALARSEEKAAKLKAKGVSVTIGDVLQTETLAQAADWADVVVQNHQSVGPDMHKVDETPTRYFLEHFKGTDKTFVYTSGTMVWGRTDGGRVKTEDGQYTSHPQLAWRVAIEKAVKAAAGDLRTVIVRPAWVYDSKLGGQIGLFVGTARQAGVALYPGDGNDLWSYVHSGDVAELYLLAIEKAASGADYNVAAAAPVRVKAIAEAASRAFGNGETRAMTSEESTAMLQGYETVFTTGQFISADRAREELGWKPTHPSITAVFREYQSAD